MRALLTSFALWPLGAAERYALQYTEGRTKERTPLRLWTLCSVSAVTLSIQSRRRAGQSHSSDMRRGAELIKQEHIQATTAHMLTSKTWEKTKAGNF